VADEEAFVLDDAVAPPAAEPEADAPVSRDRDLLAGKAEKLRSHLAELSGTIWRGYQDQAQRADDIADYWDCYNCESNGNRYYSGIADIYLPIIKDAVDAIVTRWSNQLFPQSGRTVEVVDTDGAQPRAIVGLLEHYLRQGRFETQVAQPLLRNGLVEGHLNLYCDWAEIGRQIVSRETHAPRDPVTGAEMPGEEIEDIEIEDIIEGRPVFEVVHDTDVLVLPPTADTIEEALAVGGSVTIVRKWTKAKIDQMADAGVVRKAEAKTVKNEMAAVASDQRDIEKELIEHVGIKGKGGHAAVWETWHMLPLDDDGKFDEKGTPRLCRVFFGPKRVPLGAKRNPYWNDRCPLLSGPLKKIAGVFKGGSPLQAVESIQYEANDAVNEGADAATLSAAPMIFRDPEKYNGPIVYNVGAVIDCPPDAIKIAEFPDLTPRAIQRVQMAIQAIFQSLSVNPSMLPQQMRAGKPTQAQIAQDQQVDLLTTAEGVKVVVETCLTPALGWAIDLDYQFRDRDLLIRQFGEMGVRAKMEAVAPLQNRSHYTFIWRGGEQVKMNAMMQQLGTGWLNVLRDPAMRQALALEGYQLHLAPAILANTQNIFGAFLGSSILIDQRTLLTMDPELENGLLADGHDVQVHPLDDDPKHLQAHQQAMAGGDPHGMIRAHIMLHLQSMQMKNMASMQRSQAMLGGGPQPGQPQIAGPRGPQPGAQPQPNRPLRGPPGQIHPDQLPRAGMIAMPRK